MSSSFLGLDPALLTLAALFFSMVLVLGATVVWGIFWIRTERLPAATRHDDIRERLALKQVELVQLQQRLHELDQKMHDRDRLVAEVEALQRRVDEVRLEHENLVPAREEIARVKEEAAAAVQEKASIEEQKTTLEQELLSLQDEVARMEGQADPERISQLKQDAQAAALELEHIRRELDQLRPAYGAVRHALEQAEEQREQVERRRMRVEAECVSLEAMRDVLASQLRPADSTKPTEQQREAMLADLVAMPACLVAPATLRGERRSEPEALADVDGYLRKCGLSFSRRTLRAFHTSLKINDSAQLTVLAGVSGTGKSLLPRRYAEAMGIHFLQVAVEPRWDSPQDLLGFYNYVEGRYRATELARVLAHLDPWRSLELPEGSPDRREHMALVLLDEMNLARVEYYFSEFLSRLEARPAWQKSLSQDACRDAQIPVDIRGLDDPPRLFPAHNLLFVGTMNDDESTQSLSDKVLDRGNVLQFPAPSQFSRIEPGADSQPPSDAQSFQQWQNWVRPSHSLSESDRAKVGEIVGQLAVIMQGVGRPFGHRLSQAIHAYVANYPVEKGGQLDVRQPLADQVELRILPKLRGTEIDHNQQCFDDLSQLVRTRLDDDALARRITEISEEQARGSGLFVWRGLAREE